MFKFFPACYHLVGEQITFPIMGFHKKRLWFRYRGCEASFTSCCESWTCFCCSRTPCISFPEQYKCFYLSPNAPVNFDAWRRHSRILPRPLEAGNSCGILTGTYVFDCSPLALCVFTDANRLLRVLKPTLLTVCKIRSLLCMIATYMFLRIDLFIVWLIVTCFYRRTGAFSPLIFTVFKRIELFFEMHDHLRNEFFPFILLAFSSSRCSLVAFWPPFCRDLIGFELAPIEFTKRLKKLEITQKNKNST